MSTGTTTTATTMHDHHMTALGSAAGVVGFTGLAVRLAESGWTPELLISLVGVATTFGMMLTAMLKAGEPYFRAWLESRKPGPKP